MVRSYVLIGNEESLVADMTPAASASLIPEIDLANPISLKEITKAATQDLEQQIILKVLQANRWSRQKTAKWLNISYRSLLYKLQESKVCALAGQPSKIGQLNVVPDCFPASLSRNEMRTMEPERKMA
jgi:two-component system response regulator AtoC